MADISATFVNGYSESRHFVIYDVGRDPNVPQQLFEGYLDAGQSTSPMSLYQADIVGKALYQRSDGAPTNVDVFDGETVSMS